ncbi:Mismatch repair protein msh3 [Bacidia gigantensis]|uniref:Mismatch repair protein msh3 n=1 Tax=Bacidia gigantensis TaxID=2732470 RepID=UPI001D03AED6|nr:Mismatch repair protein msh3 [Bacidia gigantensis]KAG8525356.1 Mismatch repair protein msh3 [Bacidia gigantensis]
MPVAASLSQSSATKQQSISSFFGKTAPAPTIQIKKSAALNCDDVPNGDEDLLADWSDYNEENVVLPGARRKSNTQLTGSQQDHEYDTDLPEPKRLRLSDQKNDRNDQHPQSRVSSSAAAPAASPLASTSANGTQKISPGRRTSKYTFSSSPVPDNEDAMEDEATQRGKDQLHQRFVQKLGRPDSIAEIKRRNWLISEETHEEEGQGDEPVEVEEDAKQPKRGSKGQANKKGASKLTPMERQYLDIKRSHLDAVLIVEVGYKFKFFGEDARVAAKELSIVCIPGKFRYDEHPSEAHYDRFASASVPVHRLHVHVKRLVSAGHKVGVVRQLETAALKAAGDNRNAPFTRKLTNLYTKGTYIDDIGNLGAPQDVPAGGAPATGYLACLTESNAKGWGTDEKVHTGLVAVQPATGDVIYDDFEDGFMRSEIETRLLHIAPCEILIVGSLSKATEKLVHHLSGSKMNVFGDKVRVERVEKPKTAAAQAYSHVSNFYAGKMRVSTADEDGKASRTLEKVLNLEEMVMVCLSAMITHLTEYGLEHIFDLTKYFQSFSARSHMLLNGTSLTSLEIYKNQTDHTEKGSLFWTLDRTKTRFGQRLLRKWVGRPLLVKADLEQRVAAIEDLKNSDPPMIAEKLKRMLSQIRTDLEKSLVRIYYGKCTRPELLSVLQTLQRIANEFAWAQEPSEVGFRSSVINEAIAILPTIAGDVVGYLDQINPQAATSDDRYSFFREESESDDITTHKLGIASVEQDLDAYRSVAAEKLKKMKVDYVVVAGIEYLIEVDNHQLKNVPASWAKISGTKKNSRFHTPEVIRLIRERDQHKEALAAACDTAFSELLASISSKYQSFRDCIQALGTLDCLLSLAAVATQPGYVKPQFTDTTCIDVKQGRHPMVEQLLLDAYVPNDIDLAFDRTRGLLLTGPNMGGKSSYVRQVALIAIMGQIGSYVPAESATLGILDAVFTRMGAFDNMMTGESTFMVELSETSDILKQATSRSLVILDELGRGTSTHDGVAIAQAVLDYVIREKRSLTLFITHYQKLAASAKAFQHDELRNFHMRFEESEGDKEEITFLYEVGEGVAHRSYGLNVARLANVPDSVLEVAAVKSKEMEADTKAKGVDHLSRSLRGLIEGHEQGLDGLLSDIEQL